MNGRRDKRFGLFTACLGEGEESRAVVFPGDYYSEEGSRYRGGKLAGPEERKPLSIAQNILGRIPSPDHGNNRARVIRNCGRRSRVASSAAGNNSRANGPPVLSRRLGQRARACVCATLVIPLPQRDSPPLARIFALDSCPHIRCTAESKVIRPRCQIGDLNALNRAEVVIRYRLLPAAASCRGRPPPPLLEPSKKGGDGACEMGYRYDTPNVPWGVRESAPMRARQINRESVSERAGRGEAGCGASEFFRVKRFSSGPSFGRIGNRLESLSLSFSVLPAGGILRRGFFEKW